MKDAHTNTLGSWCARGAASLMTSFGTFQHLIFLHTPDAAIKLNVRIPVLLRRPC